MRAEALGLDDLVGAERGDRVAVVGVADRGDDLGAGGRAELHGGGADAAGRAVDEQPLAGAQLALGEERVVGGGEDLGGAAGLGPVEAVGHGHQQPLVDGEPLALAAAADEAHDAVAGLEARGALAERRDLAGDVEPRDVLRPAGRRRVEPALLHHVGAVEAGGTDRDQHLAVAGRGLGMVFDDDLAVADGRGAHVLEPTQRYHGRPAMSSAAHSPTLVTGRSTSGSDA